MEKFVAVATHPSFQTLKGQIQICQLKYMVRNNAKFQTLKGQIQINLLHSISAPKLSSFKP